MKPAIQNIYTELQALKTAMGGEVLTTEQSLGNGVDKGIQLIGDIEAYQNIMARPAAEAAWLEVKARLQAFKDKVNALTLSDFADLWAEDDGLTTNDLPDS